MRALALGLELPTIESGQLLSPSGIPNDVGCSRPAALIAVPKPYPSFELHELSPYEPDP